MTQVWKIAPGDGASDWELFRENDCIGIGWRELSDFNKFKNEAEVLTALKSEYGAKSPGDGKTAARMIWGFVKKVQPKSVVVANQGRNRIVGIGIITGDYLPPASPKNPIRRDTTTHRHHVRTVDWIIKKPVDIAGIAPKRFFFVQHTIKDLKPEQIEPIILAYLNAYPGDNGIKSQLKKLFGAANVPEIWMPKLPDLDVHPATSSGVEGRKKLVRHFVRERDRALVDSKKASVDPAVCEVCGFDFRKTYGRDYCEVHHLTPLADLEEDTVTTLDDLAIVCANCHRMIHLQNPPLTISELRQQINR